MSEDFFKLELPEEFEKMSEALENIDFNKLGNIETSMIKEITDTVYNRVQDNLDAGREDWPMIKEVTQQIKGSDLALEDSGELKRSIEKNFDGVSGQVGIMNPRGEKGDDLNLVANVMEEGATVPVTEKMRKYLATKGVFLRKTTKHINIPARPVVGPSMENVDENLDEVVGPYLDQIEEMLTLKDPQIFNPVHKAY